jgi:hypothetical protein
VRVVCLLCLCTLLLTGSARAASAATGPTTSSRPELQKTVVFVEHTGTDAPGRAFVAALRAGLAASPQFTVAVQESDATLLIVVVSVSPEPSPGAASAVSLAYVANTPWRSLLGSAVRFVGADRAATMGKDTVSELRAVLTAYTLLTPQAQ